jgi:beta-glucosidase
LLKPGESQTLTFTLSAKDLASFQTKSAAWIADAGTYTVKFGTSEQTKQSATFKVSKDLIVEKTNKVLVPKTGINELSFDKVKK